MRNDPAEQSRTDPHKSAIREHEKRFVFFMTCHATNPDALCLIF